MCKWASRIVEGEDPAHGSMKALAQSILELHRIKSGVAAAPAVPCIALKCVALCHGVVCNSLCIPRFSWA